MTISPINDVQSHDVSAERQWRLLMDADDRVDAADMFLQAVREKAGVDGVVPEEIPKALHFASQIEYQHGAVPSHVYLKHPLRVAMSLACAEGALDPQAIVIALLHNVLEVSSISAQQLHDLFGAHVATAIAHLTVDRAQQYDAVYKNEYYACIEATSAACARVKVADKFDNIYMLCFNPSEDVRTKYLDEIDRWVIPMARRVIAPMGRRIAYASAVMRETGYLEKDTEIEKARKMKAP